MDGGAWHGLDVKIGGADHEGCAFIIDDRRVCGAERRPNSSYCTHHHALCHIRSGSDRERYRLREEEALATAIAGTLGRRDLRPPDRFLRRLDHRAGIFLRANRSCFVHGDN